MRYQTIIWDWNGTLLHDAALCRRVMNGMLASRNLPLLSPERYEEVFDFPVATYYRRIGLPLDRESFEDLGNAFMAGYEQARHACRLRRGARALLASLHGKGARQAVLSAYRQDSLESLLAERHLTPFFDVVVGASDHYARGKTEEGRRLKHHLRDSKRMLMIGDTLHDVDVACAMGIDCALVYGGHQSRRRIEASGARVFANLDHLGNWLLEEA